MNKFLLRKGQKKDCLQVWKLIKELAIYEKAEEQMILSLEQLEADGFGENPKYGLFVTEGDDGEVIGMALYYEKYSTWTGSCVYLEDLIVTENKRGVGAGKALFEAVIKEAQKRNSGRMEWQVLDWNEPSIEFYKRYNSELDNGWINGKLYRAQIQKMELA